MESLILEKVNGHNGQLEDWSQINWRKVNKTVRNLRRRIFRARKLGQWKQLRNLQKLMDKSMANLLLSVRQITQTNSGKNTAGIDGKTINTPEQRLRLVKEWEWEFKAQPTKRVYIPKSNGKKRPLGIPTVKDRIRQAMVKNSLEPEWEAVFEPNSYGFRKGRSCHDAIEQCFKLCSGGNGYQWVLDADIEGFFNNIKHDTILNQIGSHPSREVIREWLKAGFSGNGKVWDTKTGTPQGGVISPLLANIGLHGLEGQVNSQSKKVAYKVTRRSGKNQGKEITNYKMMNKLKIVRYADDFIITANKREDLEEGLETVKKWMKERGLEISKEKTKIVHINEGFNFLGVNIRKYKNKLLIKPQKEKVLAFCKKIGEIIKIAKSWTQERLIRELNPILRGFANYYRFYVSKDIFGYIDHRIWQYLWKWAKRRHPKKGRRWVKSKYFRRVNNVDWTFICDVENRKGTKTLTLARIHMDIPIVRHVKVTGENSPDDPTKIKYWENRNRRESRLLWTKGSKYYLTAKNQNWICPVCGEHLKNGEEIETHHIKPIKVGGRNDHNNLIHVHKPCHKLIHSNELAK